MNIDPEKELIRRQKLSDAHTGRKQSPEQIKKAADARRGSKRSEETKKKQSEAAIRRYQNPYERLKTGISQIGKTRRNRGPHSEETKRKIGDRHRNRKHTLISRKHMSEGHVGQIGEKASNWRGGISFEPYCDKWNREFRSRITTWNKYCHNGVVTCEGCGTTVNGREFNRHHVYYDKKACCAVNEDGIYYSNLGITNTPQDFEIVGDPNKFVVICDICHGKSNRKKERVYWARYYEKIINEKYKGKSYLTKEEMRAFTGNVCSNNP